ncbi:MAG: Na+/H+ antiporter subunit E, partial [Gammaproteobacteria bacterium]
PHLRLAPRAVTLELALPAGPARYILVSALSLLPGTLSVSLDGARLVVHALTAVACVEDDVRNLETRIARMFGVTA